MDAADLDLRARTLTGCIPPHLVSRLVELGHCEEVEFQAGRGEWFCAREWARLLAGQDRHAEALDVLASYVATGWWTAVETAAGLLEGWGRVDEAVALARPHADAGDRFALDFLARLLARLGRGDEAFALLRPHIEDWFLAAALVDISASAGRDAAAASLLAARLEAEHRRDGPCCRRGPEPWNAIDLLATIRERQGRVDEAIALLHTRQSTSVNNRDQLADLLARHNRIEELAEYAATDDFGHAAQRLAEVLEERGDVDGAIAAYRHPGDEPMRRIHGAVQLAQLLVRHDRGDEATQVLRSLADSPDGAEDWIVHTLCAHYADQGRPQDALAYLDALKARRNAEDWDFFAMRLPLMTACGRHQEAIEQARTHPEGGTWYAAEDIAHLLADAGRPDEAVAVLEQQGSTASNTLARHLIDLGRVNDAVALLQQREPMPTEQLWTGAPAE